MLRRLACLIVLAFLPALAAPFTHITFEDGTDLELIGTSYAGVTFTNVAWLGGMLGYPHTSDFVAAYSGTNPDHLSAPPSTEPMIIQFTNPVSWLSLALLDWGISGARVEVYNAVDPGPIASNLYYSINAPGDQGYGNYAEFSFGAPGITELRLYQPGFNPETGVGWTGSEGFFIDDLQFGEIPEPASLLLLGGGLLALGLYRRKSA